MNIKFTTSTNVHPHSLRDSGGSRQKRTQQNTSSVTTSKLNTERIEITTTASEKACGRTSFKGNFQPIAKLKATIKHYQELGRMEPVKEVITVPPGVENFVKKHIFGNDKIEKSLEFVAKNSLMAEALFALVVTCVFRPAVILSNPGKGDDKSKNQYAAAHSVASGLIGLATTFIVSQPIKKACDKALAGYKSPNAKTLRSIMERIHSPVFLPLRAMATIALIPVLLGALGIKKSSSKPKQQDSKISQPLPEAPQKKVFQSFAGVNQYDNK